MSLPPTLLTLPAEIRLKVLHYALYIPSPNAHLPNAISVFWPRAFNDPDKYKPSFYGTRSMSSLLVLSKQLYAEASQLLYTRFIFSFPHYMRLPSVIDFTTTIGERARGLVREIIVGIHLDLGYDETESFIRQHNLNKLAPAKEALLYLRERLPGLTKVHLSVGFVSGPFSDVLVRRRVNELADMVMGLAEIFIGHGQGIEVVVSNQDKQRCRRDILEACRERIGVSMAAKKAEELQDRMEELRVVDEKG